MSHMKRKWILMGLVSMAMLFTSVSMADYDRNDNEEDLYDIFGKKITISIY